MILKIFSYCKLFSQKLFSSLILHLNLPNFLSIFGINICFRHYNHEFHSECIEQVFPVELKDDGKYVMELMLNANSDSSVLDINRSTCTDSCTSLQFQCPSEDELNRWINTITLALSISVMILHTIYYTYHYQYQSVNTKIFKIFLTLISARAIKQTIN